MDLTAPDVRVKRQRATAAPRHCVLSRQLSHNLRWINAYLQAESTGIKRVFRLDAYLAQGERVKIRSDASPWGMGAFLMRGATLVSWYSVPITECDCHRFGHEIGDAAGQQTWEALAILVALRLWSVHWRQERVLLDVSTDNVSALTVLASLRGRGAGVSFIGRELALDFGQCAFLPDIVQHTPGVANVSADLLSRRFQPAAKVIRGAVWAPPPGFSGSMEAHPPTRDEGYYRSLLAPPMPPPSAGGGEWGDTA